MALTLRSSTSFTNLRDHKSLRCPEETHSKTISYAPIKPSCRVWAEKLKAHERVSYSDTYGRSPKHEKLHEISIPQETSDSSVPVFVMLPLDTISMGGKLNKPKAMNASLMALKSAGVKGVMVNAWWGLVEKDGPNQYNWERLF